MTDFLAADMPTEMDRWADRLENDPLDEAMQASVGHLQTGFASNFQRKADAHGSVWPARKDNLPHPLMVLSGDLLESTQGSAVIEMNARHLSIGTTVIYAATHQFGDSSRNIPRRQYFYATEPVLAMCEVAIADELEALVIG